MKRIIYASGDFLTDDTIADALMDYASVLAIINSADVVKFPGIDSDGAIQEMQLVIGPASQILCITSNEPDREMNAAAAADELHERARKRLPNSFDVADTGGSAESDAESTTH